MKLGEQAWVSGETRSNPSNTMTAAKGCAGLVVFGYDYGWVDLRRGSEGRTEPVQAPYA